MRQKLEAEINKLRRAKTLGAESDYVAKIVTAFLNIIKATTLFISPASDIKGEQSPATPRSSADRAARFMPHSSSPASPRSTASRFHLPLSPIPLSGSASIDLADANNIDSPRILQFTATPRASTSAPNLTELLSTGFGYFNAKEIIFDLAFNAIFDNQDNPISEQALANAFRNLQLSLSVIPEINKKLQPILDFYSTKSPGKPRAELIAKIILFLLAIYLIAKQQLNAKNGDLVELSSMLFGCLPFDDILSNLMELQKDFARFNINESEKKCLFLALGESAELKQQEILQEMTLLDCEQLKQDVPFGVVNDSNAVTKFSLSVVSPQEESEVEGARTSTTTVAENLIIITYNETISVTTLESTVNKLAATNPGSKLLLVYLQSATTEHPEATAIVSLAEAKKATQFTHTAKTTVQEFREQILTVSSVVARTLMADALSRFSSILASARSVITGAASDAAPPAKLGSSPTSG